jgi:hypothetical protein
VEVGSASVLQLFPRKTKTGIVNVLGCRLRNGERLLPRTHPHDAEPVTRVRQAL